jgi:hypothetical protein
MPIGETTPSWYTPDIDAPAAIAFDATHLYWTSRNVISKTPFSSPSEYTLLGKGTPPRIAAPTIDQMEASGERLYWRDDSAVIGWLAIDGSACGQVALGQDFDLHDNALYASDKAEGIRRVPLDAL